VAASHFPRKILPKGNDMMPPVAGEAIVDTTGALIQPLAVSVCLGGMRKRADFLKAASAKRQSTPSFLLQARHRDDALPETRVGFTCSKKVGNSVARNRAKRRLREIARLVLPDSAKMGWDYVLVGRAELTATHDFKEMQADLQRALTKVHGG
jgi:ribonuclease P protein component